MEYKINNITLNFLVYLDLRKFIGFIQHIAGLVLCGMNTERCLVILLWLLNPLPAMEKKTSEHVLCLSCMQHVKLISAYRQTVWTQIRLLLEEQYDLDPHCLQQRCFKWTPRQYSRQCLVTISSRRIENLIEKFTCL